MSVRSQVVVITGAGSGIGKACALKFADAGASLVVVDRDDDTGRQTVNDLQDMGVEAVFCHADVSREQDCTGFANQAMDRFGHIDVLVANAGIRAFGTILDATEDDWDQMLAVNLKGVNFSCKAVLPKMIEQKSGAIVLIGSTTAMTGRTNMPIYDVTKFGVLSLNRSLAATYGKFGIRVNTICPSKTITEFHLKKAKAQGISPEAFRAQFEDYGLLGRAGEPEEIAAAVYFMASKEASFITGQHLMVDGGYSIGAKPFT
ncbi:MAG: SDR family oxidoreductase [Desulfobacterales bacterium]|nr:SDR family oxidoreductase [Desulfobacterales bacterium]MDX2512039.1 SDR family oxidoreductase [Desulfobacterales bacterium]